MKKIPLYNCYWCKCAYCYYRTKQECIDKCLICAKADKFRLPKDCNKFLEDTSALRLRLKSKTRCEGCVYMELLKSLKKQIEEVP